MSSIIGLDGKPLNPESAFQEAMHEIGIRASILINWHEDGTLEWSIQRDETRYPDGLPVTTTVQILSQTAEQIMDYAEKENAREAQDGNATS